MGRRRPISSSNEVQGGTPVFAGTRVPVDILFDYLEDGQTVQAFLAQHPSVSREQAIAVLETARTQLATSKR